MDFLRACVLCAAFFGLAGASSAYEEMKEALLQKLGLEELPDIHKRDLENLVVPAHVRSKYVSMLKLHRSRKRRSVPSLAGILRGIPGNADISGEYVYSDSTRHRMAFDMDARIPNNSEVTMAELKLFQQASHSKRFAAERRNHRAVNNARVSIYWLDSASNRTSLVDSRLISIRETGWKSFDVTQAVHYWAKTRKSTPMHLEVWIEGERPGSYAAEMAKSVRFTTQEPTDGGGGDTSAGKPELVLYTLDLEEYGSRGDCDRNRDACCREEHFVNFRSLTWTQYWVIEPAGYQAYRCTGGCKQPRRHFGYGERRCTVAESAPLPIMYLVKKGDYTEIEVAEFPNMIVERCACTLDNVSVV